MLSVLFFVGCVPVLLSPNATIAPGEAWVAPENSWSLNVPPETLRPEGFSAGQVVPDFRLLDQNGQLVSIWQFYGEVVVLDVSTTWCAPCQALAAGTEQTWSDYRDQGFVYLTVMAENITGDDPSQEDLNLWVDNFGLTSPVMADVSHGYTAPMIQDNIYPALLVIDREMRVHKRINPPSDEGLRAVIESVL